MVFDKIVQNQTIDTLSLQETFSHLNDLGWFTETCDQVVCIIPGFEYFITQKSSIKIIKQLGHLYIDGIIVDEKFTRNELKLLTLFLSETKNIYPKEELFEQLWENNGEYSDWALDKTIHRLRTKLNKLQVTSEIKTLRGRGYSWQS